MKRFNLSGWAVSHPTLILFLMIVLGAAGFFSYQRLGRAEDPFFTVKVVNVSAIWPGATAQEMQTQVADPIEKKLQELPFFEKVQTYSKPSFTAMQVTFKDSTPPKDVPYLFYLLRKKLADVQGQLPAGLLGPTVNDEFSDVDSILYMMTGDGADYAQLKKAAEGMRQRLLKVHRRHQGQSLRHPGRAHLRRVLARQAGDARHHAAGAVRFAGQAEQRHARRHGGNLLAARAAARHRRARRRQGGCGDARSKATAACSGSAISPPSPTASSIRRPSSPARKASPRSASAWSPPRAPTFSNSARRSRRRPTIS